MSYIPRGHRRYLIMAVLYVKIIAFSPILLYLVLGSPVQVSAMSDLSHVQMKEPDMTLVINLFVRVREKDLCSPASSRRDSTDWQSSWRTSRLIYQRLAILFKGSGLGRDVYQRGRIAQKTMDPNKLNTAFKRGLLLYLLSSYLVSFSFTRYASLYRATFLP
ncbi:hypothetical protein F5148DRAFT_1200471 [Russula earlei]|uniref:Uncharacterized protein n=1 Tax=Russula earlei TaxID=71964 RepID=A0ACC0UAC1_9AGAM|nr:hypothetical protein F5148DRAFT_1200471 [Russula earlei]